VFYVSRKRYGRASGRFKGAIGYIGELWGNQEDLDEHCIYYGSIISELALDCLANSCKIAFGSSIDEILSLSSVLLKLSSLS
jgi:hypothetical protein